jgi:hypothetical protein
VATFKDRLFEDQLVALDGTLFEGCHFRNCTLLYAGGSMPGFSDCAFEGCGWQFEEAAGRTVMLLKAMAAAMGSDGPVMIKQLFVPEKPGVKQNADGRWQVELDPGQWVTCQSKDDADLLAWATARWFESNPDQTRVRHALGAMERSGLNAANSVLYRMFLHKLNDQSGR